MRINKRKSQMVTFKGYDGRDYDALTLGIRNATNRNMNCWQGIRLSSAEAKLVAAAMADQQVNRDAAWKVLDAITDTESRREALNLYDARATWIWE